MTKATEPTGVPAEMSDIAGAASRPNRNRVILRAGLVIAIVLAVAIVVPSFLISAKKQPLLDETEERLQILAQGRADVLATWLEGVIRPAGRVVDSELFRLFATEVDLAGGDLSALASGAAGTEGQDAETQGASLVDQLPFIERVLTDFSIDAEFVGGYIISRTGDPYVATAGAAAASTTMKAIAAQALDSGTTAYGPARPAAGGLAMDVALPIFAAQTEVSDGRTVAALVLSLPLAPGLSEALAPQPLDQAETSRRLVQRDGQSVSLVQPGAATPVQNIAHADFAELGVSGTDAAFPFTAREALTGGVEVYSYGAPVTGPAWWLVEEQETAVLEHELQRYATIAIVIAALMMLTVLAAFGAFWWRLSSDHNHSLAEQYRRSAARISAQKRLLDSINDTVAEQIGLKSASGEYRYVNPAFARAAGRDAAEIVGLDDAALFGAGTAERLKLSDQRALAENCSITSNEEVYLAQKLHYLQVSKVPYKGEKPEEDGIVSVSRDVTELVEEQKKKEQAIEQIATTLVRAIELRDPYLAGHSRRVAGFSHEVAVRMGATDEEIRTVEIAAQLSQIGKLKVPRAILNKPERHNESEMQEMRRHIDYATDILKDVDFDLPVYESVAQMHERLDGGGYPKGLKGADIRLTARILGVCDVFCARVEPRAYRAVISPDHALQVLAQNPERYDPRVVEVLREVVSSVPGEKLIAGLANAS